MVAIRDLQVSMDIAKMKELGWFQQEFIVYGCCYWEKGKRYYRVSDKYAEIGRFREWALLKGIYSSPIIESLNRSLVPSGMQKEYMTESKLQLALRLQRIYSRSFFDIFHRVIQIENTDEANSVLRSLQRNLIGCFERKPLEVAQGLIDLAYRQKKLTFLSYREFSEWIADRLQQMADDTVIKKNIKRSFYGFGYRDDKSKIKFFCNAYEDEVFKRRDQLICKEVFCSPIISETYYYSQMPDMTKERNRFLHQMADWMDESYWEIVNCIQEIPSPINDMEFIGLKDLEADLKSEKYSNEFYHYYRTILGFGYC